MGATLDDAIEGQILAGKYRVERVLGVGGMGVVVSAHHLQLDERVALKFMLDGALANAQAVARFAREARAAVKIKSEHVARVSDVGALENGAPQMVMEYPQGDDLAAWLKQHGRLPIEQACSCTQHLATTARTPPSTPRGYFAAAATRTLRATCCRPATPTYRAMDPTFSGLAARGDRR